MMGLAAPQSASRLVTLTWTPVTQPAGVTIDSWNVYRSTVSGGPYTFLVSILVATLTYTDNSVAAGGTYFYVITSVDTAGVKSMYSPSVNATILLGPPLSVSTATIPPTIVGATYNATLSAVGGSPPYTWEGSGVPGWTVNSAGLLSGTPTQSGVFVLSLTVDDSTGATATASIPVVVAQLTPSPVPNGNLMQYVDCGSNNGLINSINNALASLNPSENNTVYVLGACIENVAISGFERL